MDPKKEGDWDLKSERVEKKDVKKEENSGTRNKDDSQNSRNWYKEIITPHINQEIITPHINRFIY